MCLVSNDLTKEIAKQDMIVYKVLRPIDDTTARATVFEGFEYVKGRTNPRVNISPQPLIRYNCLKIDEAYHAYRHIPDLKKHSSYNDVYRMIIPKGTVYYTSDINDDIASETNIMSERVSYNHKFKGLTFSERCYVLKSKIKSFFNKFL